MSEMMLMPNKSPCPGADMVVLFLMAGAITSTYLRQLVNLRSMPDNLEALLGTF